MIEKLRSFLHAAEPSNSGFTEGGEYWHLDNASHNRNRADHYKAVATKALRNGNKEYSELNTRLSEIHGQLAEYHQKAALRRK